MKAIESFYTMSAEWAKTMSLLVDNGADVVSEMRGPWNLAPQTPQKYLLPY
jgi:hypothetical protein